MPTYADACYPPNQTFVILLRNIAQEDPTKGRIMISRRYLPGSVPYFEFSAVVGMQCPESQHPPHIFQNAVERRDEQQGNVRGKQNTKRKAYCHGDEKLCLNARLEDHGREAEECCE